MAEIIDAAHVTCVKQLRPLHAVKAAKYRSRIAELSGFEGARCASDAD
ncbi:hypothetical protein [Streptomyces sp. NBC_01465]|nr:hypothetical protein [Streptomyces sp. NBC_01465]